MKKGLIIILCLIIGVLYTQCYKEPVYEAVVKCYISDDGIVKGDPAAGCDVVIGKDGYADFASREGVANSLGQFKATFQYEGLLEVKATTTVKMAIPFVTPDGDTLSIDTTDMPFLGKGELKLVKDKVAELEVLLVREF